MRRDSDEKVKVDRLKRKFKSLKEERDKRLSDWKDVQKYVAPSIHNWDNPQEKVPKRPKRFTSRPTQFARTLRSGLVGYSISPNIVWLKLTFEDQHHLDKIHGAKDWLEEVERKLYAEFSRSNLYKQTGPMINSAVHFGHGVMLIDEVLEENKLRYTALKIQELYLDIDEFDETSTIFRRYSMSLKNAASFFGKENLSETQQEDIDRDDSDHKKEITILHAVYKREEYNSDSQDAKNMPFASVYIDENEEIILMESGYTEFPYAVFIWEQLPGTPYGESPSIDSLDDIRILNKLDEQKLRIAQMAGSPAYNVPESMRESVNVVPNGYNYWKKPEEIITPILSGLNFPISLEIYKNIEDRVKDWFHVDFFLALQHNQSKMTATEVMELQGEKAAVLADLVVNLNSALQKIIQRSFNLLWRQRRIPQPPPGLAGSGANLKVEFMGPLAQAQKKYHESAGIGQAIGLIGSVAQIAGPTALDVVDFDQALKRGLEGLGFPQEAIREDKDIEALRKQRAEMEAQNQQRAAAMEMQKQIMGNVDKLNQPVHPGSALAELNNQMAGGLG